PRWLDWRDAPVSREADRRDRGTQQLPRTLELERIAQRVARPRQVPHAAARSDLVLALEPVGRGRSRVQRLAEPEGLGTERLPRSITALRARLRRDCEALQVRSESTLRRDAPATPDVALAGDAHGVDALRPGPDARASKLVAATRLRPFERRIAHAGAAVPLVRHQQRAQSDVGGAP